ncbi:DUF5958 family protein [Elizabethkingia occulta]|uniref:DUF5958 family protein n=1 Tax=Elizabethkingia occulta TaxID=1867263 RepID=UPI00398C3172
MTLEYEILFNKYGQDIILPEVLISNFLEACEDEQKDFFNHLLLLIQQSKAENQDIEEAIKNSGLKSTYTPCVVLKKGIEMNNLTKISKLPNHEKLKSFRLLLELFKIAYKRRFELEKGNTYKWWYWDLSDPITEKKVYQKYFKI